MACICRLIRFFGWVVAQCTSTGVLIRRDQRFLAMVEFLEILYTSILLASVILSFTATKHNIPSCGLLRHVFEESFVKNLGRLLCTLGLLSASAFCYILPGTACRGSIAVPKLDQLLLQARCQTRNYTPSAHRAPSSSESVFYPAWSSRCSTCRRSSHQRAYL